MGDTALASSLAWRGEMMESFYKAGVDLPTWSHAVRQASAAEEMGNGVLASVYLDRAAAWKLAEVPQSADRNWRKTDILVNKRIGKNDSNKQQQHCRNGQDSRQGAGD